jgi:hypothetical protein
MSVSGNQADITLVCIVLATLSGNSIRAEPRSKRKRKSATAA